MWGKRRQSCLWHQSRWKGLETPKKVGCGGPELSCRGGVREGFLEEVALGWGLWVDGMCRRDEWEGGKGIPGTA